MQIFESVEALQTYLDTLKADGQRIGFVPTMGALHQGHLSLIKQSKAENDCTVCSIFVNPTQFNEKADLEKYPRTTTEDTKLLLSVENDVLFLPSVDEIYPKGETIKNDFDFGKLEKVMEGAFRDGHFAGVAQVVNRLLDIVRPHHLYMGQKDFQQLTIIRDMLRQLKSKTQLVMCPIVREKDGLAMSSRNVRLTNKNRKNAVLLYETLLNVKNRLTESSIAQLETYAMTHLNIPGFRPEYFNIVNGVTLQPIEDINQSELVVACTAVWAGNIRLIDNIILKNTLN